MLNYTPNFVCVNELRTCQIVAVYIQWIISSSTMTVYVFNSRLVHKGQDEHADRSQFCKILPDVQGMHEIPISCQLYEV